MREIEEKRWIEMRKKSLLTPFYMHSRMKWKWGWVLEDKEAHFVRKSVDFVYFHFKSNEGPLLQRVIKCNKVKYENRRAQRETRDNTKMTCK